MGYTCEAMEMDWCEHVRGDVCGRPVVDVPEGAAQAESTTGLPQTEISGELLRRHPGIPFDAVGPQSFQPPVLQVQASDPELPEEQVDAAFMRT